METQGENKHKEPKNSLVSCAEPWASAGFTQCLFEVMAEGTSFLLALCPGPNGLQVQPALEVLCLQGTPRVLGPSVQC